MIDLQLEGSYNARGIGEPGGIWLARSAAVDSLTLRGERTLREHGIDLIIDLREAAERGPSAHALEVRSVPLYGRRPPERGTLESIYLGLLRERGGALTSAVTAIAAHPGVALVHCTAGKDRTGLVIALARLAAGDSRDAVIEDYARSGAAVRPARLAIAAEQLRALDLSDEDRAAAERLHLDSPAEALEAAIAHLDGRGGARAYLLDHGAAPRHLEALAERADAAVAR